MADDWSTYATGPFCRHYADPEDCDEVCAACGHRCPEHDHQQPGDCMVDGCDCKGWEETP